MHLVELPLRLQIQLFKNVVASAFSVHYCVPLLPADHHQFKALGAGQLSKSYSQSVKVVHEKTDGEVDGQLLSLVQQPQVIWSNFRGETAPKMLVEDRRVESRIVKVIEGEGQDLWSFQLGTFQGLSVIDDKVANDFTPLEYVLAHKSIILIHIHLGMMLNLQRKQRCYKIFFFIDLIIVIILVSESIYQSDSISQAQNSLSQIVDTPTEQQFCQQLCSKGYNYQQQELCCTSPADQEHCLQKEQCKEDLIAQMNSDIHDDKVWLTVSFILLGLFLMNMMVLLLVSRYLSRVRTRQQQEFRRNMIARMLFLANIHSELVQEEQRLRRRSLLTESFITEDTEENCSICLENFEEKKAIKLNCNHLFHRDCIQNWIECKTSCPVCRAAQ